MQNKKIIKIITAIFLSTIFFFNFSFAQLNAKWYTKSLEVKVGDIIKIDLFVYPREDHPVVTVSNTLNYDNEKLEFIDAIFPDNWFVLPKKTNNITDAARGVIQRTGGVANGIFENTKYLTYEFKAVAEGEAKLSIIDGVVLDYENIDLGLQKKQMLIKILPALSSSSSTNTNISPQTFSLGLDVFGKNAIRVGEDYKFDIYTEKEFLQNTKGTISIQVLNNLKNEVFRDSKTFSNTSNDYSSPTAISFSIPNTSLPVGDYSILLKTIGKNFNGEIITEATEEKEFGVLASDRTWIDLHQIEIYSFLAFIILLAALYHIHCDHIVFQNLRRKARESHELHVLNKK